MLISLCLACAATLNPLGQTVTFSARAGAAPSIILELAKTTNIPLEVAPETSQEIILVSVKDAPLQFVMDNIARVTSSKWRLSNGVYKLVPDVGLRAKQKLAEDAKRLAFLNQEIGGDETPADDIQETSFYRNPDECEYNCLRLLKFVNSDQLGALPDGERAVFSTEPNSRQYPLAQAALELVKKWQQLHNKNAERFAAEHTGPIYWDSYPETDKTINAPISKVLVAVQHGIGGNFEAKFLALATTGKILMAGKSKIDEVPSDPQTFTATPRIKSRLVFSKESQTLIQWLQQDTANAVAVPTEVADILSHPDTNDPLSYSTSECLLELAKYQNKQLIACLPDAAIERLYPEIEGDISSVEEQLVLESSVKTIPTEQAIIIMPSSPAEARETRMNRVAMAKFVASVQKNKYASLDSLSTLAVEAPNTVYSNLGRLYLSAFSGPDGIAESAWKTLQFYALLTEQQRKIVQNGGSLKTTALGTKAKSALESLIFSTELSEKITISSQEETSLDDPLHLAQLGFSTDDYRMEITELLPEGLQKPCVIVSKASTYTCLQLEAPTGFVSYAFLTPESYVNWSQVGQDLSSNSPGAVLITKPPVQPQGCRLAAFHSTEITIQLPNQIVATINLTEPRIREGARIYSMASLPEEIQKKMQAVRNQRKETHNLFNIPSETLPKTVPPTP